MTILTSVPAVAVAVGDELRDGPRVRTVTNNVTGHNRQRYLITETADGSIHVYEYDPSETVSVWR